MTDLWVCRLVEEFMDDCVLCVGREVEISISSFFSLYFGILFIVVGGSATI